MIVVDTSVWIEFFKGNLSVFPKLKSLLEKNKIIAADPVFGELMQGAKNKWEQDIISSYWYHLPKFSMDGIYFKAGSESGKNGWQGRGIGLIDCSILVYARERNCKVWTLDKKFLSIIKYNEQY